MKPVQTISRILIGTALVALLLIGSARPRIALSLPSNFADPGVAALNTEGKFLYTSGRFFDARTFFLAAARAAVAAGDDRAAAMNRNNAGAAELVMMQYGDALKDFTEARRLAEKSHQMQPLLFSLNNLASLYVQTGQADNAIRVVREALDGPAGHIDEAVRARLLYQMSEALVKLDRFDEAAPYHYEAVDRLTTLNQLDDVARLLGAWGNNNLRAGRLDEAERALNAGLLLVRVHRLKVTANILTGLASLAGRRHQPEIATRLFEAALQATEDRTPRWKILAERGRFRLDMQDDGGAMADFREAARIAMRVRADMVPADQDRVAFETGIGQYLRGLVEAGNRLALRTGDPAIIAETFDASEQGRLWSLRSLVPGTGDWRSRLPASYWEKLARYQGMQRRILASSGTEDPATAALQLELQLMEAEAGGQAQAGRTADGKTPLQHVRSLLDRDTVLFSFHVGPERSWIWASDQSGTRVFPLPPEKDLQKHVDAVASGVNSAVSGKALYAQLFGSLPKSYLQHPRWLVEPDGPLHDVPFAALVADERDGQPVYLVENAAVQVIPGVLLLEKRAFRANGPFVGVGDPVYNAADARFPGRKVTPEFSLPRLPNTARELQAASTIWSNSRQLLLTGMEATEENLWKVAGEKPSILHFATHVVKGAGEYRSGLIALGLNPNGNMELLGPREILARSVSADLVVMNGCHSEQGEAVPNSGRMGLTRAWIGAGAGSVLATRWDIPDGDAESMVTDFYRLLRANPGMSLAEALRRAQLTALHSPGKEISRWAGYYLLSRTL